MDNFFFLVVILLSAIMHEYAHGWMANYLGDPTAKLAGRLTLNPVSHIDPIGTILVPVMLFMTSPGFIFGWAKPVPYNPYNLRNQRWGSTWVALVGPGVNFLIALVFAGLIRATFYFDLINIMNVVGLWVMIIQANIILGVFNLMPIPPLDGSKLLFDLLPDSLSEVRVFLERYGFFILLLFILLGTPFLSQIIYLLTAWLLP